MSLKPCRRILYAYETRILFLLLNQDKPAGEIGRTWRESAMPLDGIFSTPALHHLSKEFLAGYKAGALADTEEIIDVDLNLEQMIGQLDEQVDRKECSECPALLDCINRLIHQSALQLPMSGCRTYAVVPGRGTVCRASDNPSQVVECIFDQRTGQAQLHRLL